MDGYINPSTFGSIQIADTGQLFSHARHPVQS
jgi:hypothetical protein